MKRECLLSKAYTGAPMMFSGHELFYSPLVNEILRELDTAFFGGPKENQTDNAGMVEGILVMFLNASGAKSEIHRFRNLSPEERAKEVISFYIDHEEEINALKPQLIERIQSAMAAAVESESMGKSRQHPQGFSPS